MFARHPDGVAGLVEFVGFLFGQARQGGGLIEDFHDGRALDGLHMWGAVGGGVFARDTARVIGRNGQREPVEQVANLMFVFDRVPNGVDVRI